MAIQILSAGMLKLIATVAGMSVRSGGVELLFANGAEKVSLPL
jgi:hypothetical protein